MKYAKLWPVCIFSVAICIAAIILGVSVSKIGAPVRTVYVKGLCEIERPADHVVWPLAHTELSNSLQTIYASIENKNNIILNFLQKGGVDKSEISVNNILIEDRDANNYSGDKASFRYKVTQVITISTDKVDTVRQLIAKQMVLLKQNIFITSSKWEFPVKYSFNALQDVKPMMIQQATQNARMSAQKFADDSESQIGKIKTASQGQLSITPRDENTPHIKTLRVVTSVEFFLQD